MTRASIPYTPASGDDEIVEQLVANDQALQAVLNGQIQASVNALVAAAATQTGRTNTEGSSGNLARADHTHVIQSVEALATAPTTGNFVGREYVNTADSKKYYCTSAAGSGTFIAVANMASADIPIHATRHSQGGADALANGAIANAMLGRTVSTAGVTLASGTVNFGSGAWGDLITGITVTSEDNQLCYVTGQVYCVATAYHQCSLRLYDTTTSTELLFIGPFVLTSPSADGHEEARAIAVAGVFTLNDGDHSLKLQGCFASGAASEVKATKNFTAGDAVVHQATTLNFVVG